MADPQLIEYTSRFHVDELLLKMMGELKDKTVLDIGCGNGDFLYKVHDKGAKVLGADISDEIISSARSKYPNLEFRVLDPSTTQIPGKYDFVVMEFVTMFVKDMESLIRNSVLALKPEGEILVSILHPFFVLSMQKDSELKVGQDEDEYFIEKVLKINDEKIDNSYFSRSISWYINTFSKNNLIVKEMIESNLKFSELDNLHKYSKIEDIPVVMLFKLTINKR